MNRELKFRAWDSRTKKWLFGHEYPNLGGFSIKGEVMLFGEYSRFFESIPIEDWDRIILMQFTGLHDKNGKYIYESDILFHHAHERKTVMKWVDGFCCFAGETIDDTVKWEYNYYQRIDQKSLEVIGNIYENPELLNK